MKRILLLETGREEGVLLATSLHAKGFCVVQALDEESAMTALSCRPAIDLAIMIHADCDWLEFLISVRKKTPALPVVLLTKNCGDDKSLLRNRFPGVTSLSLSQRRTNSSRQILLNNLDRQIRIALSAKPALAA